MTFAVGLDASLRELAQHVFDIGANEIELVARDVAAFAMAF
jgi:hypothetical protein